MLVVGETIIDEYLYCEALGKSGKEPVLAVRHNHSERFAGGIAAVANHVSAFCARVGMLTFLGRSDSQEDFIREQLDAKVDRMFLYMEGDAPTIVKRRFVELYPRQNLFEVYVMGNGEHNPAESAALSAKLNEVLPEYDIVIATDYGHGMIGPEAAEVLCDRSRFLAINTQVNAGKSRVQHRIQVPAGALHIDLRERDPPRSAESAKGPPRYRAGRRNETLLPQLPGDSGSRRMSVL